MNSFLNRIIALAAFVLISCITMSAQNDTRKAIQFSGKVVTADVDGNVIPLPYVNIGIRGTSRGTSSIDDGYFSLVALEGDTIAFTRIGFNDVDFVVPDTLSTNFYFYVQIMAEDDYLLPEAVIFPWPSREHFVHEFLAIDITDQLRSQAERNLANEVLSDMRHTVPADGTETSNLEIRTAAKEFQYSGQYKPQNIFNPLAWKKFIESWRNGDFKSKEKKAREKKNK